MSIGGDSIPVAPLEVGRDNLADGLSMAEGYLSEIVVENYTPHQRIEILTRVITLEQDAFPVPLYANDPNTTPISVSSSDSEDAYVQWEPMGDLYPATETSIYGSYKYLRVHFEVNIPAGTSDAELTINHPTRPGPYQYYAEKRYIFRSVEPQFVPSFTLTPAVLSALGALGNYPVSFEMSAHGYVNHFNLINGLYGQDRQTDYPDGSSITNAFRETIYNRFFGEIGNVNESPITQGQACLKKEYTVYGRIMPDLDCSTAFFDPVTGNTSGADAPTIWYNLNYELQHNKNSIPFVLQFGVGMATYDDGDWNPSGKDIDYKNRRTGHQSTNHGKRAKSFAFTEYLRNNTASYYKTPLVFSSQDDITFSVIGADVASPTSGVEVCAVYQDTYGFTYTIGTSGEGGESLSDPTYIAIQPKTIFNWFDKANRSAFEIENLGLNCLPYTATWTLRGKILLNENNFPNMEISAEELDSQEGDKLEELQAVDQNFHSRGLFTPFKYGYPHAIEELYTNAGFVDEQQLAASVLHIYWDGEPMTVQAYRMPRSTVTNTASPFYGEGPYETASVKLLKDLHDPWAQNPIGCGARPGFQGGQPGFNVIGFGGLNATTGRADLRFLQKCTDLEWNRAFCESERDGRLLDFEGEQWKARRFIPNPGSISNTYLTNWIRSNINPASNEWTSKTINSWEFSATKTYIEETNVIGFAGLCPTFNNGSDSYGWSRGQVSPHYGGSVNAQGIDMVAAWGTNGVTNKKPVGYPISKYQTAVGYPGEGYFYITQKQSYVASHVGAAHQIGYALLTGDKVSLRLVDYYINAFSNHLMDCEPARVLFFGQNNMAPDGYKYNLVGRQEGRPYSTLLMCLGTSKNQRLIEKTIYKLSRRFWNVYFTTNFEEYPFGVPNKPWRTVRYPAWSDGVSATINNGVASTQSLGSTNSAFVRYWNFYKISGDPYHWIYLPSKLKITDVNPTYNKERSISWDAWSVLQYQSQIYVPEYTTLQRSSSNGSYRISCDDSPMASAIPISTEISRRKANEFCAESFQNGLRYPYFFPIVDMFYAYSTIAQNRANQTIAYPTRHANYGSLGNELYDTYNEFIALLVRFCRSAIRNLLYKVSQTSPYAANKYGLSYFQAPCSKERFFEDYTDSDRTIHINADKSVTIPNRCLLTGYNSGQGAYEYNGLKMASQFRLGYMYKALIGEMNIGNSSTSTNTWTFTLLPFAWDILYRYGGGEYETELNIAREYIIDMIGEQPYDAALAASNTNVRNSVYPEYWGVLGIPSPGNIPKQLQGKLGSHEAMTWWNAMTDDLWKDRYLQNVSVEGNYTSESLLSGTIEVESNRVEINVSADGIIFESSSSGSITIISAVNAYVRDEGNYGMALATNASASSDTEVIVYLIPDYTGELLVESQALTLSTLLSVGSFEGELDTNTVLVIPISLSSLFKGEFEPQLNTINKTTSISVYSHQGESDFNLQLVDVFINIPATSYLGELNNELSSYSVVFNLGIGYVGDFSTSASYNLGIPIVLSSWIGETIPANEFTDLNPDYEYLSETIPNVSFSIYPAEREFNNFNNGLEGNFQTSAASSQIIQNSINSIQALRRVSGVSQRLSFERQIFKEISDRTRGDEKVSEVFRQTLEYLINTFNSLVYIDEENKVVNVPCWHGNTERAIAKIKKGANIILPVTSIYKEKNEIDINRRRAASLIVQEKWWDTDKQRAVRVVSLAPVPVKIGYKLSVWGKYQEDIDHISEQIHRIFNPDLEIYTEFNSTTKAFLLEEEDSSELNIGDGADRLLKRTFIISVESYIPNPKFMITNTGKIEELNTEVCIPI